jgi:ketosteroid isomerase-like protein
MAARTPRSKFWATLTLGDASTHRTDPSHRKERTADGDTVTVVWDGRGVANDGTPYENSYAWIMRLHGGKVVDGTAFYARSLGRAQR